MTSALERLDERVEAELRRFLIRPDVTFEFKRTFPGRGCFYIRGETKGIEFEYWREYDDEITLHLRNSNDIIRVYSDDGVVESVAVNDRLYRNPAVRVCGQIEKEPWQVQSELEQETAEAIQHGKKKLDEFHKYLNEAVPSLMQTIAGYFSRSLIPPDDRVDERPNAEIFNGFDLKPKKT